MATTSRFRRRVENCSHFLLKEQGELRFAQRRNEVEC
jgi:hypothetical protein